MAENSELRSSVVLAFALFILRLCLSKCGQQIAPHSREERGTAVAQWLRCCATNRKVAGSIPDGVIGTFH